MQFILIRFSFIIELTFSLIVLQKTYLSPLFTSVTNHPTPTCIIQQFKANNEKPRVSYSRRKRTLGGRCSVAALCCATACPSGCWWAVRRPVVAVPPPPGWASRLCGRGRDLNCCGGEGGVFGYSAHEKADLWCACWWKALQTSRQIFFSYNNKYIL